MEHALTTLALGFVDVNLSIMAPIAKLVYIKFKYFILFLYLILFKFLIEIITSTAIQILSNSSTGKLVDKSCQDYPCIVSFIILSSSKFYINLLALGTVSIIHYTFDRLQN